MRINFTSWKMHSGQLFGCFFQKVTKWQLLQLHPGFLKMCVILRVLLYIWLCMVSINNLLNIFIFLFVMLKILYKFTNCFKNLKLHCKTKISGFTNLGARMISFLIYKMPQCYAGYTDVCVCVCACACACVCVCLPVHKILIILNWLSFNYCVIFIHFYLLCIVFKF